MPRTANRTLSLILSAALVGAMWSSTTNDLRAQSPGSFDGAVYAMSNDLSANTLVGYGRLADGTLSPLGSFPTGGRGGTFDGGEGLDPLISAYAVIPTDDFRFVLAVNAGSDTLSVFRVEPDFTLTLTDQKTTLGTGPNSLAYRRGIVYVSNIDADGVFTGEPDQEGSLAGFRLTGEGRLVRIQGSRRELGNRPSAVRFTEDGRFLVVASINSGSAALASGSQDELVVYAVDAEGRPSENPVGTSTSTLRGNTEGRNLPSAIGFEIVRQDGRDYVVVTEAREFQANGAPPAFNALQTGSVSTWRLEPNGFLTPIMLDVLAGNDFFDGERTACWIAFNADDSLFWVSNALESTLSTFSFDAGRISLVQQVAAAGRPPAPGGPAQAFGSSDGWIDLWTSEDGSTIYQLFGLTGEIGVFDVTSTGLNRIQTVAGALPSRDTQGIIAIGRPRVGAVYAMSNALGGNGLVAWSRNEDGTLRLLDRFATGGLGGTFDGGEGLDPLISAYAVVPVEDRRLVLAVNAGSNSITSFRVRGDFSLDRASVVASKGVGPNSLAVHGNNVYVSNIDADGIFNGEPDQEGSIAAYRLTDEGELEFLPGSRRVLGNRPSAVRVSPDGRFLIVASINAGSSALASGSTDELVVYALDAAGMPSANPIAAGASTLPGNAAGRNLPSAIGFEIVAQDGAQYVVVTEAREFRPDGSPPAFAELQTGSVSTWRIEANGSLTPIMLDVLAGNDFQDGERTACWIAFSADGSRFWVSNALESTLSTFTFDAGVIALEERVAASGTPPAPGGPGAAFGSSDGWIDLWLSADGRTLYQLYGLSGAVGVFDVAADGSLTEIQEVSGALPLRDTQGIVAMGPEQAARPSLPGTGEDFLLASSVGARLPDSIDCETATAGDLFTVTVASPAGSLLGAPVLLGIDAFATAGALPSPVLPELALGCDVVLVLGADAGQLGGPVITPLGIVAGFRIPPGLEGTSIITQAVAIASSAGNGSFAATDAHVLEIR